MVSMRDRALIEARAAGVEPEKAVHGHWRQMLRLDIIGPAFAISIFLVLYYMFVAFLVVYFATVFRYTEAKANNLSEQVKTLQTVDPTTLAALKVNPANTAAQARALSELSGLSVADVQKVVALGPRYKEQLATLAAIDPTTLAALSDNPANTAAGAKAVGEIAVRLGIAPATALGQLHAVASVPPADLAVLRADGPKVQQAGAGLRSISTIPSGDVAYLSAHGSEVAKAQKDNPGQWQTWWWICFICQVAFIPFVFLLTGRWSPRKARADEREHQRMVERELARLQESQVPVA
jgi:ACS family D-galactonate transporter-like MFS transporter